VRVITKSAIVCKNRTPRQARPIHDFDVRINYGAHRIQHPIYVQIP